MPDHILNVCINNSCPLSLHFNLSRPKLKTSKAKLTVRGKNETEMITTLAQLKTTAMEFALPRAYDGNTSLTKNHGMEPRVVGEYIWIIPYNIKD